MCRVRHSREGGQCVAVGWLAAADSFSITHHRAYIMAGPYNTSVLFGEMVWSWFLHQWQETRSVVPQSKKPLPISIWVPTTLFTTDVLNEGQPAAGGVTHNTGPALCCCDSCHLAYWHKLWVRNFWIELCAITTQEEYWIVPTLLLQPESGLRRPAVCHEFEYWDDLLLSTKISHASAQIELELKSLNKRKYGVKLPVHWQR